MTNSKRIFLVLLLCMAVLSFGSGCGARVERTSTPPPPPIDENLLDLIPNGPNAVLWVDLAEVRSSSIWQVVEPLTSNDNMDIFKGVQDFDPVIQGNEIVFIYEYGGPDGADQLLFLLKGKFSSSGIIKSYLSGEQAASSETTAVEVGGFAGVRTPEFIAVAITERTLALGTESMINRVAGLANGDGGSKDGDPDFTDLSLDGPVAARLRYHSGRMLSGFDRFGLPSNIVDPDSITGLDASLTLGDGVVIGITATAQTQMDASVVAGNLEKTRREFVQNMFVVFLGIDWVLDRISITHENTSISVSMKLDNRDVEELGRLVDRIERLRELVEGEGKGMQPEKKQ